jgi:hypothetical protein
MGAKYRRNPPAPLSTSATRSKINRVIELGGTALTPTTSSSTRHTSSSGKRISVASGDTFGIHRRLWGTSPPLTGPIEDREVSGVARKAEGENATESKEESGWTGLRSTPRQAHDHLINIPQAMRPVTSGRSTDAIINPSSPPSIGTPLRGLREEKQEDSEEESYTHSQIPLSPRIISKVDQLLGRGAYEAGMAMEVEKKILQEALARSIVTQSYV